MGTLDFSGVVARSDLLAAGLWLTVQISLAAMLLALAIGMAVSMLTSFGGAVGRAIAFVYVELIRNTPFIVQVFVLYFGLPALGVRLAPVPAAIMAMAIYGGAYTSEIIRAGIDSIARGQVEAARALGLSRWRTLRHVVLKPALAAVFPSIGAQFVLLLLSSSVVSAISVPELTGVGNEIQGLTLRNLEVYLVIALAYVVVIALLRGAIRLVERAAFPFKFLRR